MNNPLISIIMPAKNAAETIAEAIESVLAQEYEHWELWVVDNDSSDATQALAKQFSDHRIHVLESEIGGVSVARNMALERVQGSLLCFLDADDRLPPLSLRKREERFRQEPEVSFVDGQVRFYDRNWQNHLRTQKPSLRNGLPLPHLLRLDACCFSGITWMVRWYPEARLRFNWEMTHAEDLLFFARCAAQGGRYDYVDDPVYDVRVRSTSAMKDISGQEKAYLRLEGQFESLVTDRSWKDEFRKKARRILFRSYLKRGKITSAIRVLLRYFKK